MFVPGQSWQMIPPLSAMRSWRKQKLCSRTSFARSRSSHHSGRAESSSSPGATFSSPCSHESCGRITTAPVVSGTLDTADRNVLEIKYMHVHATLQKLSIDRTCRERQMQLIAALKVERHFHRHHLLRVPAETRPFLSFPYVCPEPVLIIFIYQWRKRTRNVSLPQHDHRLLIDRPPPCEIQPSAQLIVLSGVVDRFIGGVS
jgi:hypothetical protein